MLLSGQGTINSSMGCPNKSARFKVRVLSSPTTQAESWGTFVGYCVPQLIAVCVIDTEIKISALVE